jgi:hypothetical protein
LERTTPIWRKAFLGPPRPRPGPIRARAGPTARRPDRNRAVRYPRRPDRAPHGPQRVPRGTGPPPPGAVPLQDLDVRGLAGGVGSQQAEASPRATAKLTPRTASMSAYFLRRSVTSITVPPVAACEILMPRTVRSRGPRVSGPRPKSGVTSVMHSNVRSPRSHVHTRGSTRRPRRA